MNRSIASFVGAAAALLAAPALADTTPIGTRAAFDALYPGATLEDFEEARVADGEMGLMAGPLDRFTSNSIFQPGEIVAGLSIDVGVDNDFAENLFVSSPGIFNYTSHAVSFFGGNTAGPKITIDLAPGVAYALAMDVTSNPEGRQVTVELFSGASLLGSYEVVGSGAGTFFGVDSNAGPITRVTMTGANFFGVDNVAFAVPAPGAAGLLPLALLGSRRRR